MRLFCLVMSAGFVTANVLRPCVRFFAKSIYTFERYCEKKMARDR